MQPAQQNQMMTQQQQQQMQQMMMNPMMMMQPQMQMQPGMGGQPAATNGASQVNGAQMDMNQYMAMMQQMQMQYAMMQQAQMLAGNPMMQVAPAQAEQTQPAVADSKKKKVDNPEDTAEGKKILNQPISQVKRPKSSYILFHHENCIQVKKDNPTSSVSEIAKMVGAMWNNLSEEKKNVYKQKAAEDKARYEKEIAIETKSNGGKKMLTQTQKQQQVQSLGIQAKDGDKKKRAKDPNAPKKPLTPFFIFLKQRRMELANSNSEQLKNVTSFTSDIGKEWNLMTTEQKLEYRHDGVLGKAVLAKADQLAGKSDNLTVTNAKPKKSVSTPQQSQAPQKPVMPSQQQQPTQQPQSMQMPNGGIINHMNGHGSVAQQPVHPQINGQQQPLNVNGHGQPPQQINGHGPQQQPMNGQHLQNPMQMQGHPQQQPQQQFHHHTQQQPQQFQQQQPPQQQAAPTQQQMQMAQPHPQMMQYQQQAPAQFAATNGFQ